MISRLLKEKVYAYYILRNLYNQEIILSSENEETIDRKIKEIESRYENTPKEVFSLACFEQVIQGNPYNPISFVINRYTAKAGGGFDWDKSILGYSFWTHTLGMCDYRTAVELYNRTPEIKGINHVL